MRVNECLAIIAPKVLLVPYSVKHVPQYHIWMEDEELRFLTSSDPLTLEEEYGMQKSWRADGDKLTFIVCLPVTKDENVESALMEIERLAKLGTGLNEDERKIEKEKMRLTESEGNKTKEEVVGKYTTGGDSLDARSVRNFGDFALPPELDSSERMIGDVNLFLYPSPEDESDYDSDGAAAPSHSPSTPSNPPSSSTIHLIGEIELMIARKDLHRQGYGKSALHTFLWYILTNTDAILREYATSCRGLDGMSEGGDSGEIGMERSRYGMSAGTLLARMARERRACLAQMRDFAARGENADGRKEDGDEDGYLHIPGYPDVSTFVKQQEQRQRPRRSTNSSVSVSQPELQQQQQQQPQRPQSLSTEQKNQSEKETQRAVHPDVVIDYLRVLINHTNVASIRLFESVGFRKVTHTPNYFGEIELRWEIERDDFGVLGTGVGAGAEGTKRGRGVSEGEKGVFGRKSAGVGDVEGGGDASTESGPNPDMPASVKSGEGVDEAFLARSMLARWNLNENPASTTTTTTAAAAKTETQSPLPEVDPVPTSEFVTGPTDSEPVSPSPSSLSHQMREQKGSDFGSGDSGTANKVGGMALVPRLFLYS